jgi:hypothetical protein
MADVIKHSFASSTATTRRVHNPSGAQKQIASVVRLSDARKEEIVSVLTDLLECASRGELAGLAGEFCDGKGRCFLVRAGVYNADGELAAAGFRLQVKAAFPG